MFDWERAALILGVILTTLSIVGIVGGAIVTFGWRLVIYPQLQLHVFGPIAAIKDDQAQMKLDASDAATERQATLQRLTQDVADVKRNQDEIKKELHPNGGSSLRDRVDEAVRGGSANGELIASHILEAQSDRGQLVRLEQRMDTHLEQAAKAAGGSSE